jgi:ribose transport system permease protein
LNTVEHPDDLDLRREARQTRAQRYYRLIRFLHGQGLVVMLLALGVFFSLRSKYFLTGDNLLLIGAEGSALGIMAATQTYLIIARGIDLSVGSVVALSGVVMGLAFTNGTEIWFAVALGLLVGVAAGLINGVLAVVVGINPLIVSIGTLSFFSGLAYKISGGNTLVVANHEFDFLGSGEIAGIPFPLILFAVVAGVAFFVQRFTRAGRMIYAIGGNPVAAELSGIPAKRVLFGLYILSGLSAALVGMILTSQLNSASPQVGSEYLLSVVTAVILGGTSLNGGTGSIVGTTLAVALLTVISNGFGLIGFDSSIETMVLGIVLIIAVVLDQLTNRLRSQ